uniref:Uncharacterized protein TCIL3000_11_15490 n=1 Tax=Trypanosoma congolense (strain IL3000) TaxID=1068625 RepID=G0V307_TRYCI|nr:unnamed protein product [Trypanosoma congolense IL3000]
MPQSQEVSMGPWEQPLVIDQVGKEPAASAWGSEEADDGTHGFDMLAVDVILGDGSCCSMDFVESAYLMRLITHKHPVRLEFGSEAAVLELKRIVTSLQRTPSVTPNASRHGLVCDDVLNVDVDVASSSFTPPPGSVLKRKIGSAFSGFVRQRFIVSDSGSYDSIFQRTRSRNLFMEVLELSARLEMERTFSLLCSQFGRIYVEEVFLNTDIQILISPVRKEMKLNEIKRFSEKVLVAFGLEDRGGAPHLLPQADRQSPHHMKCDVTPPELMRLGQARQRWLCWLQGDRYFFPELHIFDDLTQSIDPGAMAAPDVSYVDEDFATENGRLLFQNPTWEVEDAAQACPICKRPFMSWSHMSFNAVRASHCRRCGRRICKQCTSWRLDRSLAKLSKPGKPEEGRMRSVCWRCFDQATKINRHAFLCDTFIRAGLSIVDIALLRSVNEQWKGAAELCLSDYRSSLYQNMWNLPMSGQIARILFNSVKLLVGHPESLIFLFISIDWGNEKLVAAAHEAITETVMNTAHPSPASHLRDFIWKPNVCHWYMLCTRTCGLMYPPFFGIKILECLHRAPRDNAVAEDIRNMITKLLLRRWIQFLDACIRECVVLLLLDIFDLESCQRHVTSVLLALARLDQQLALVICQEASTRLKFNDLSYRTLRERVIKSDSVAHPESHHLFLNTLKFLKLITPETGLVHGGSGDFNEFRETFFSLLLRSGMSEVPVSTTQQSCASWAPSKAALETGELLAVSPMLFPFDASVVITHVSIGGIVMMNSGQQPIRIPLLDDRGVARCILVKKENLEKDKVMCVMSRFLQWVLHKQLNGVVLPTYRVILLSPSSGLIEVVEAGQTVQHVLGKHREGRLLQHLMSLEKRQSTPEAGSSREETVEGDSNLDRCCEELGDADVLRLSGMASPSGGIRECFLCSAKFFILLNYIFAIGDRHRENVMVHPSGAIFHIDFGMLLTRRTLAERVTSSYVRFDFDLEECANYFMMNTTTSEATAEEQREDMCAKFIVGAADWFLEVRSYAGIINQLLSHIVRRRALDGITQVEELTALMNKTLMRNLAETTCKATFCRQVRESRGQMWLKDFTHETHKWTRNMVKSSCRWLCERVGLDSTDTDGYGRI